MENYLYLLYMSDFDLIDQINTLSANINEDSNYCCKLLLGHVEFSEIDDLQ